MVVGALALGATQPQCRPAVLEVAFLLGYHTPKRAVLTQPIVRKALTSIKNKDTHTLSLIQHRCSLSYAASGADGRLTQERRAAVPILYATDYCTGYRRLA